MPAASQFQRALRALEAFYRTPLDAALRPVSAAERGRGLLHFFHGVVGEVPAYQRFLRDHGVEPATVRSSEAFRQLPRTTKQNYHQVYPLPELCRHGKLEQCDFVAMSSGSTGKPTVWPRFVSDELGTALRFEQVLADTFDAAKRRTLGVVCFSLGSWVGGMFTTQACRHVAAKGYPLTLVTPGSNIVEILRVVRALAPEFDQVVLFGYPPFLKDVVDAGRADGLDWSQWRVGIVTAGEVFSEEWRQLVCDRLGAKQPEFASASLYGTADGGVLANETPLSVSVRRFLAAHPTAAVEVFGEARLPTLCQFEPTHRAFECEGGSLTFTGDGGVPLVRYDILDRGGLYEYADLMAKLADLGFRAPAVKARELPFVYVFGRSGFAVSFYGANVYPENVGLGLEQADVAPWVTGKFVLQIVERADAELELEVAVELARGSEPPATFAEQLIRGIRHQIERVNSEFRAYVPEHKRSPRVRLVEFASPAEFPAGVKHRYTREGVRRLSVDE